MKGRENTAYSKFRIYTIPRISEPKLQGLNWAVKERREASEKGEGSKEGK
jgi:hypothetical protein